jgi:hypothetical protein
MGDRGPCPTKTLELPREGLDVVAGNVEQRQLALLTPRCELAEIQGAGVAGKTRVTTQEPDQRLLLDRTEHAVGASLDRQS